MFDLKENSARFGNCQYCETSCERVCCACKAWYCGDPCIADDWNNHKNNCKPRTVHIDHYENTMTGDNHRLPRKINEREKISTKIETPFIPTDRFTKIVVSWVDEPIYWVYKFDDVETQSKIAETLNLHCTSIRAKRISPDDKKCCALFDGAWYRAKIRSKDGDTAVVRFIDFGNDASIKLSEAVNVPDELTLVKPLAFKVRFTGGKPTTITLDTALDVKAIKQDGDTCEVQIQGFPIKNEPLSVPPPTLAGNGSFNTQDMATSNGTSTDKIDLKNSFNDQQRQNISDNRRLPRTITERETVLTKVPFIPTEKFTKIVVSWVDEPIYWVYKFDDVQTQSKIAETLNVHCTSIRAKRISPDNQTCCALFDGAWYRAKILSKDGDTAVVRFFDFGNDASIKLSEAVNVPDELTLVKPLAFKVRFTGGKPTTITLDTALDVKAIKQDGDTCEVQIQGFPIKNEPLSVPPPTLAGNGSFNTQDMATSNGTSTDKIDLKNSFNDQQRQNISDNRRLPRTITERETVLTKVPFIPTEKFTKIVVSWVDEPIYWVYKFDDVQTQSKIAETLNVHCTSIRAKRISPDDQKCCALFDGAWYRAKILSKDGDTAVVRFIDFGNDASIKLSEAMNVPDELTLVKPLAFKVRFTGGKPNTITLDSALDVKAVKQDGDTCEVQIQGFPIKNEPLSVPPPTVAGEESLNTQATTNGTSADKSDLKNSFNNQQRQNISDNRRLPRTINERETVSTKVPFIPTDKFTKIVVSWVDEPIYWVYRFDDVETQSKIAEKLNVHCTSIRAKRISPDDKKCCALFDGAWYRAKILTKDGDTAVVRFIDFGNDASIKLSEAMNVPDELTLVKPLAFKIRFTGGKPNTITLDTTLDVKAIKQDGDTCEVQIQGFPMKNEPLSMPPPTVAVSLSMPPPTLAVSLSMPPPTVAVSLSMPPPTVASKGLLNTQDMATKNGTSVDKSDLKNSFNNQQRQNISDNRRFPRTINERETVSTKVPFIPTDKFTKIEVSCNRHDRAVTNSTSGGKTDPNELLLDLYHIKNNMAITNEKCFEGVLVTSKLHKPYLPTDKISKIVVSGVDKSFYWAFDISNAQTQVKIEEKLNAYSKSTRAKRIAPNDIEFCAPFEGGWYRAKILSRNHDSAVVRFIDVGNTASVKLSEALKVPDELVRAQPLAFKVKFSNGEPPMNTPIDVNAIKQDGDICEVRIHEYQVKSEASAFDSPPSTVSVNELHTSNTNSISTNNRNENDFINTTYTIINDKYTKKDNSAEINKQSRNQVDMSFKNLMTQTTCNTDDHKVQVSIKAPPIPTDRFSKIVVSWIDEPTYWVFRLDDAEIQTNIEQKLNVYCTSTRAKRISPNENKCCAPFDGGWYRAQILSKENDTAVVKFIDFGNDASIKLSEALTVPEELVLVQPLAFQVRFPHGKPNTITLNSAFDVKAIKMDGDVCEAQIEGYPMKREMSVLRPLTVSISDNIVSPQSKSIRNSEILKETTPPRIPVLHNSPKRRNNHLIYQIEPSLSTVSVQTQTFIGENCMTGFILVDDTLKNIPAHKSIKDIAKELAITKADPEFKPSLMDEVCARLGGIWYRGFVTLINPDIINVALVDIGVIVVPDALARLPQHLKSIAESAVRCIFSTSQKTNLVGEHIVLQNLQKEAGKLTGDTDKFGQVAIIPWEPTCEDAGIISENIKPGILYKLTAFHSPKEIYLQSKEQNQTLRLNNLIRDVTTYSLKAPLLIRKPWCGQLVSCRSLKNNMYSRAQVLKKTGDQYEVKYIDSGLIETVALSNFKPLSDKLKSVPSFVTKVGLKGIPGSSFSNEAIKIMNQLMDKDSLIKVEVENNDHTKIRLFDGKKDINRLIYEALLPSWSSRNKTDSVIFMSNDIMHEKWLNGQNMRLTILLVKAFNEIVVMNEQSKVFTDVLSITAKIDIFCSSNTTPYIPRVQEICLAKFQDESGSNWYRALCSASYENSATVYFIDFGNYSEVSHTDIRKIPPEFLYFPAASKTCKIYGLSDSLPDHIKEDIANEYMDNHVECMVVCNNSDGSAVVYVPKLMDILIQNQITSVSPPPTPFLMPAPSF